MFYSTVLILLLVVAIIIILIEATKTQQFANHSYTLPCHQQGESEWGERDVAFKYTKPDASVLEFGGGSGSVSAVIQNRLTTTSNHVVIQPADDGMYGGLTQLHKNKANCQLNYHIIDHILERGENIRDLVTKPFDTIVADCEGCLVGEYEKNPNLFSSVTQIQVERDDNGTYDPLLATLGLTLVYTGPHTGSLNVEVWEKKS